MRQYLLVSVVVWCASGALVIAQQPGVGALPGPLQTAEAERPADARTASDVQNAAADTPVKGEARPAEDDSACPKTPCEPSTPATGCFWVSADYLLWWVKDGPAPGPLVVAGPASTPLFGGSNLSYGLESGAQLSVGISDPMGIGLEGNFFIFERKGTGTAGSSDATGTPSIALPFVNSTTGAPEHLFLALPGAFAGGFTASSSSRFYGAEVDVAHSLFSEPKRGFSLELLDGFRFLRLEEDLSLNGNSIDLPPTGVGSLNGVPLPASTPVSLSDSFGTQNSFFGGELGGRAEFRFGQGFYAEVVGKASIGVSHESVTASGTTSAALPSGTVTVPGGLFANPDVLGHRTQNEFAVVPECSITAGYQLGRHVRAYVGYNFIYWSSVVRPGDQISSAVNPAVVPLFPGSGATPIRTGPPSRDTDFWAQGINFGLAFHY